VKLPWQKTTWEASIRSNVMLSLANVILVFITLAAVSHTLSLRERIVLSPPGLDRAESVGWKSASAGYVKSFGLYVATLIGNITPGNVAFVADNLSSFVDSSIYPDVRRKLLATAESRTFKETASATKFEPMAVHYEHETNRVFVSGRMTLISAGGAGAAQDVTYEMTIVIKDGLPVVTSLMSYDGQQPHDTKWAEGHPETKPQAQGEKQ
jgi:conjugal transfer pilus assembly protein TraE